jgi:hypothetical protein
MKRILQLAVPATIVAILAAAALAVAAPARAGLVYGSYSHSDPSISCNTTYNAYGQVVGRTITLEAPAMLSPRGTQQASYQAYLYRWDPARGWVYQVATNAVSGMIGTYDLPGTNGFTINASGSYWRVAIAYNWFWNGVAERSQFNWAGVHSQFFVQNVANSSTMWSGTTGDWCYIA